MILPGCRLRTCDVDTGCLPVFATVSVMTTTSTAARKTPPASRTDRVAFCDGSGAGVVGVDVALPSATKHDELSKFSSVHVHRKLKGTAEHCGTPSSLQESNNDLYRYHHVVNRLIIISLSLCNEPDYNMIILSLHYHYHYVTNTLTAISLSLSLSLTLPLPLRNEPSYYNFIIIIIMQ